jgi:symplekin
MTAVESRLKQLQQAKDLVDNDASFFGQIVTGLLPLTNDPEVIVRRWVADFLLQAFSSIKLDMPAKLDLALKCLETLCTLMVQQQDVPTTKSVMQASTLVYPLLFRHLYVALPTRLSQLSGVQMKT